MKRNHTVSCKLLVGFLAFMLMICTPEFAQAAAVKAETTTVAAKTAVKKKPSVKQLKTKLVSVSYDSRKAKLYYKIKFTNKSSVKITKAKTRTVTSLGEDVVCDKTVTLNLKPNTSRTIKVCIGMTVQKASKRDCSVKVLKYWYK